MPQEQGLPTTLKPFVASLKADNPIGHLNMTVVPLRGERHDKPDYMLASDAIAAGLLTITEISEGGSVPELMVISRSDHMILLLDGEELIGAKQNRILNTSVLLPPNAQTRIPVSCVEQGRWHHASDTFSSGSYSPARLRARKSVDVTRSLRQERGARSDQAAVWDEVAGRISGMGAASPTMALNDAVRQRQGSIAGYVDALQYPPGAVGVVVAIDGQFSVMDAFDKPDTLQRMWIRLVTGYVIDAISGPPDQSRTFSLKAAETLLEQVGEIPCTPCPTVGVGQDWRFDSTDIVGQALAVDGVCVHLGVFPRVGRSSKPAGPGILPPSRRGGRPGPGRTE